MELDVPCAWANGDRRPTNDDLLLAAPVPRRVSGTYPSVDSLVVATYGRSWIHPPLPPFGYGFEDPSPLPGACILPRGLLGFIRPRVFCTCFPLGLSGHPLGAIRVSRGMVFYLGGGFPLGVSGSYSTLPSSRSKLPSSRSSSSRSSGSSGGCEDEDSSLAQEGV